jgi:hypothetical protein
MAEKKPITVYVNPESPAEAVVDRDVRWKFVLFLSVFSLVFGGVGVGALFLGVRGLFGKKGIDISARGMRRKSSQDAGVSFLWIFAFFWNAVSFPVAILVVPQAWQGGEWGALFVLLFPLVGLLILWGAIAATIQVIRARFAVKPAKAPKVKAAAPARKDGFARGMLDDPRPAADAPAIDTLDDGLPRQPQ